MQSQNGWPASADKAAIGIVSPKVPGTDVDFPQGLRGGAVATVLMYVAAQFHKTVEPLRDGWCWGYYFKQIEGSSALSNHASGTAIDINAPAHGMGKRGTFSATQVAAIRRILTYCEGVVRWGGDYTGRADEMHFEIVTSSAAAVARVAAKIVGAPVAPKPPVKPVADWRKVLVGKLDTVRNDSRGAAVKRAQALLNVVGAGLREDGDFGPATTSAVKNLQRARGITPDGIVGPATWAKLLGV